MEILVCTSRRQASVADSSHLLQVVCQQHCVSIAQLHSGAKLLGHVPADELAVCGRRKLGVNRRYRSPSNGDRPQIAYPREVRATWRPRTLLQVSRLLY